jgi:hypothetical protein
VQANASVSAGRQHIFHVCPATAACAACGNRDFQIWLIREEWMNRLAPETLCLECLEALSSHSSGVSSSSSARDAYNFKARIAPPELKPA